MRVIYPDNTLSITANEENGNYPIENVQDDYIKRVWRATSNDAVIDITASSGSALALFGSNATSVTVNARDGAEGVQWDSGAQWDSPSWVTELLTSQTIVFDTLPTDQSALWCDLTNYPSNFAVEIMLSSVAGSILEVGVIRIGTVRDFRDAAYGIEEGLVDYSIRKELNSGAWYYRKRDIVRTFSLSLVEDRATDFYIFMHNVALLRGQQPLAWRLSENVTDWQWIVYAAFEDMPIGVHSHPNHSVITIQLKEVV